VIGAIGSFVKLGEN